MAMGVDASGDSCVRECQEIIDELNRLQIRRVRLADMGRPSSSVRDRLAAEKETPRVDAMLRTLRWVLKLEARLG